ncbi:HAD family hydrolase [Nocardia asiatica]|uniref:HAD family hydrolase n=1 Tax=Nocardia asiatica TaxID=209252 RepID=UPI0002FF511E|nr:haloacid dehalogenase-like hydrolase [Nocardia asiatica]
MAEETVSAARAILFVDVDGTLIPETSSGIFLAAKLGHLEEMVEAESAYNAGRIGNHEVCAIDAAGWAGWRQHAVRDLLDDLPLVDGIPETVRWCRSRAVVPILTTLAWQPVGAYLSHRFGFSGYCGPDLDVEGGSYTGGVALDFDEFDKRDFAAAKARQLGLAMRHCAAVGDSRSDIPLFERVGCRIAFNGSSIARESADFSVEGKDLRSIIPVVERWLEQG